jgi:hypothetical protein
MGEWYQHRHHRLTAYDAWTRRTSTERLRAARDAEAETIDHLERALDELV